MRLLDLAIKDLRQIVRDWRAAVFLLVMPIAFTLMFGFAFGGFGGVGEEDPRLPVGYVDRDQGRLAPQLSALLDASQVIRLEALEATDEELETQVAEGDLAAAVVVPPGYSQALLDGQPEPLLVIADMANNAGLTAEGEVQAVAMRLASAVHTADVSAQTYEEQAGFADAAARQAYWDEALERAVAAWLDPAIVASSTATGFIEPEEGSTEGSSENAFAQSSPGMMAQFAIAGLMGASAILVLERKSGSLRRLLTTPISRPAILLGHYLAMVVMVLAQVAILVLFGQLLLRLNYLGSPLATLLLAVMTALFVASLGLLIGALAREEDQVIVFSLIPMFVLAGLGGAWVPLEIMPSGFQQFARLTPVAWIMDGFQDIIVRGLGVEAVLGAVAALAGYTVLCFALAVWRFRFE